MAQVEALQSAFIAHLPTAEPERAEKVLRLANSCLAAQTDHYRNVAPR